MSKSSILLNYQPPKQPSPSIVQLLKQHSDIFQLIIQAPATQGATYPLKLDAKEVLVEVQPDQKFSHPKFFQNIVKPKKAQPIFVESGLCDPNKKAWYYVDEQSKPQGPYTSFEIDQLLGKGTINLQTKVALETLDKLVRIEKIIQAVNKKKEAEQKQKPEPVVVVVQEPEKVPEIPEPQQEKNGIDFELDYSKIKTNISLGQWSKPLVSQPIQVKVTKAYTNPPKQQQQPTKPTERKRSDNKSMHVEGDKGNLYQKKGYEIQQQVILEAKPKEESDQPLNNEVQEYLKKLESRTAETTKPNTKQKKHEPTPAPQAQKQEPVVEAKKVVQQEEPEKQEDGDDGWEVVGLKKNASAKKQKPQQQNVVKEASKPKAQVQQVQEIPQVEEPQQETQQQEQEEDEDEGWQTVGVPNKEKKKTNKKVQQKNAHIPGFALEVKQDSVTVSTGSAKKAPAPKPKPETKPAQPQQQQPVQPQQQDEEEDDGWIEVAKPAKVQPKKGK